MLSCTIKFHKVVNQKAVNLSMADAKDQHIIVNNWTKHNNARKLETEELIAAATLKNRKKFCFVDDFSLNIYSIVKK